MDQASHASPKMYLKALRSSKSFHNHIYFVNYLYIRKLDIKKKKQKRKRKTVDQLTQPYKLVLTKTWFFGSIFF